MQVYDNSSALNMRRSFNPTLFGMSQFNSSTASQTMGPGHTRDTNYDTQKKIMSKTATHQNKAMISQRKEKLGASKLASPNECMDLIGENVIKKKIRHNRKQSEREILNSSDLTHISSATNINKE